jgi:hypothetical protein
MKFGKDIFKNTEKVESYLKVGITALLFGWNVIEGAVFENEYPQIFVKLYHIPLWRLVLLAAVIAGSLWDEFVGIMFAFTAFFYVMDMEVTMEKWK